LIESTETLSLKLTQPTGGATIGSPGKGISTTTTATQRFVYNTSTGDLFFDADGNQGTFGAIQVANLSNKASLRADSFSIGS
jgi:Ca2+-binding RTX toxin-like protein